eukprot:scpid70538/ scgid26727/ Cysteine-rich with EGF-like domain protein 2
MWCPRLVAISVLLSVLCASGAQAGSKSQCERCKKLVKGFREGEKRTSRSNFGGGDVHWEERKKVSYLKSETRLVEIIESACEKGNHGCTSFLEQYEELLEVWWFKKQDKFPDLQDWLCRVRTKTCCRDNEFGKKCAPCPGGVEKPCNGNGQCEGAGDRTGSGICNCRYGITGTKCDQCLPGFFNETKINDCLNCHRACLLNCTGASEEHCLDCGPGWNRLVTGGCRDIDECLSKSLHNCAANQYCVNSEGSFSCQDCHTSCASCEDPGHKDCKGCAQGYRWNATATLCDDINECEEGVEDSTASAAQEKAAADTGDKDAIPAAAATELPRIAACKETETCVNKVGSFSCLCKRGYKRKKGGCVVDTKYKEPVSEQSAVTADDLPPVEEITADDDDDDVPAAKESHATASSSSKDEL